MLGSMPAAASSSQKDVSWTSRKGSGLNGERMCGDSLESRTESCCCLTGSGASRVTGDPTAMPMGRPLRSSGVGAPRILLEPPSAPLMSSVDIFHRLWAGWPGAPLQEVLLSAEDGRKSIVGGFLANCRRKSRTTGLIEED